MRMLKPDGEYAKSEKDFLDAWNELSVPICEALKLKRYGFDERGVTFLCPNGNTIFNMPLDVCYRLNLILKGGS